MRLGVVASELDHRKKKTALTVAMSSEFVQFSLSDVTKMLDYMLISAIILYEMSVHRRVIGQIACDAASIRQSSITRRNLALKVALSTEYKQFSMCDVTKVFDFKVISAIILSEMSVHLRL